MNTDELGKEFWGIILFETHILNLYQLLNIKKYKMQLFDFLDWLVYPENIPLDSQRIFHTILQNRFHLAQYEEKLLYSEHVVEQINYELSIRPLSKQEKEVQEIAVELLNLKYQNENLQPSSFRALYELLSYKHFTSLIERYIQHGFISRYRAADYLIHHKERGCAI